MKAESYETDLHVELQCRSLSSKKDLGKGWRGRGRGWRGREEGVGMERKGGEGGGGGEGGEDRTYIDLHLSVEPVV